MHRSSPPRKVAAMAKAAVAAAEVFGVDFDADDFINLEASHVTHSEGFASGVYAVLPEKAEYDRLRFSFSRPVLGAADNTVTLQLWALGSEEPPYLVGISELGADGSFPPIDCDNHQARYYLAVGAITGAGAKAVTVTPFVQGLFETLAVLG